MADKIVVLDFGSQYNQLIARRIREMGVFSELKAHDTELDYYKNDPEIRGIVFSGGPNSVYEEGALLVDPQIYELGIPVLGICYGMQLMAHQMGGEVKSGKIREYGKSDIEIEHFNPMCDGLPSTQAVWMSHGDEVHRVPEGFTQDAFSESGVLASMSNVDKQLYGVQFHPEVKHSVYGQTWLKNFVFNVCKAQNNWKLEDFIEQEVQTIRDVTQGQEVLCALSGGVDSSVVAALLHKAIGDKLTCMFVDHGLLRENEAEQVKVTFEDHFKINLIKIDAKERFLSKLAGVADPEKKRKIIGEEFIRVFESESKKLSHIAFLAQGTLYTDIIESGTKTAHTIKSHHNVGGLPKDMHFKLIEPLNMLFKDEVRQLGLLLGLSEAMVHRQPFPGPGLAIRIIGDVTEEKLHIVQKSDTILHEEFKKAGLDREIWQYFTVLTNIQSVGVMGDQRTYDYALGIRAVTSIDGMTADYAKVPYEILDRVSNRIVNEVKGVNRILYDVTSKPPATIEWE
ncbi:MAG TPA: GMP synthase (glutamine-hydrolyzing) [Erysipelotrichaceae bacterium]|nr:GMP synthase (glutamine-hydrolyzing) [Erysipelotrichaceae bacterium]